MGKLCKRGQGNRWAMKSRDGEQEVEFWTGHWGPQALNKGMVIVNLLSKS